MEKVRAFALKESAEHVEINERALHHLRDIAHRLFLEDKEFKGQYALMFNALHTYLLEQGITPNFTVKL